MHSVSGQVPQKQTLKIVCWIKVFYLGDGFRKCCEEEVRQEERKARIMYISKCLLLWAIDAQSWWGRSEELFIAQLGVFHGGVI